MARITRAKPAPRDQEEHQRGAAKARLARAAIASRLGEMIVKGDMTGSPEYLTMRLRQVAEAEAEGDRLMLQGALLEAAAAAAVWAVQVELTGSKDPWQE